MATAVSQNGSGGFRNTSVDNGTMRNLYARVVNANMNLDMCPICKSSRYLNPNMRFLVNPECYHTMCESCVDRIFSLGPAPCPYAGCGKILRKNKFKEQLFEDLSVEREVDVRKRVARTFNQRQEDFDSLESYNNYLEEVEGIVFNLVNNVDAEETELRLQKYEQDNRTKILENSLRQREDDEKQERRAKYEKERRQEAQRMALQLAQEEEQMKKDAKAELIRELATSKGDADAISKKINSSVLKRSSARRKELETKFNLDQNPAFAFLGRSRKEESPGALTPFTPFVGDRQKEQLFEQREDYYDPSLESIRNDMAFIGSGYRVERAVKQSLTQAFFGLGCYIQAEKSESAQSAVAVWNRR